MGQKQIPKLNIYQTQSKIKIDGELDEPVWQSCDVANQFYQSVPVDTSYAKSKTDVMTTYDEKHLYIAAICHDTNSQPFVIQSLKRDF